MRTGFPQDGRQLDRRGGPPILRGPRIGPKERRLKCLESHGGIDNVIGAILALLNKGGHS